MTARIWDIYDRKGAVEPLPHSAEITAVAFGDGDDVVTTTLSGQVNIWDSSDENLGQLKGSLECKSDICGGRLKEDRTTSKNSTKNKHFNSISLSPNSEFMLAGGNSKNLCLYDVKHRLLLRRFVLTHNRSLDGTLAFLNSKAVRNGEDEEDSALEEDLPGPKGKADVGKRITRPAIRVSSVKFSPDGTSFAACTTEGLMIYSLK